MPRRQVAVKVMLHELVDDNVRQMFQAESTLMAQLSTHPAILTVYEAGVAADGRPYLVMELCSPTLASRYRSERIPLAEVLRIAIRIGGAIETAHRAGVLHRDIKPSNILTTAYGYPVLSDFGIAATVASSREQETIGLSVPWSAPEVLLDEVSGTIASEVWAYAATVYSLLAGRSPFEVPGADNSSAELIGRITRARPRPIDRADVPDSLEQLLRRALVRDPRGRPATILEIVRGLQAIETEHGFPLTPLELMREPWAMGGPSDTDERTQLRPVNSPTALRRARGRGRQTPVADAEAVRAAPKALAAPWALVAALIGSVVAAVALSVLAIVLTVQTAGREGIPVVRNIDKVVGDGSVEFSWADPGLEPGDRYQVRTRDGAESIQTQSIYVVDGEPGETVCITVRINRQGSTGDASTETCAEISGA